MRILTHPLLNLSAIKFVNQVATSHALEFLNDGTPFFGFVPEEEHALGQFLTLGLGAEDGLQGVWMIPRVPCFGGYGHWCWREVLHLLQVEVQSLGDDCQLGHVFLRASRMATNEVGDDLLAEVQLVVDLVEYLLEIVELAERWLAHDVEHRVAGMFGSYLEASAHMLGNELAGIFLCATVDGRVLAFVKQEVITHTATDEALLDARKRIYRMIDVEQRTMVGIEVRAYLGMDARRALALPALVLIGSAHGIHVGTRSAKVAQVALEVGHLGDGFHFLQDAFLASAHDELALMRTDGTEGTSAETSAVQIDGELDHVESRDALTFIFRVRQAGIGKVERHVELALCHRRVRWVHHYRAVAGMLEDACGFVFVRFFFDETEILCFLLLVAHA